MLVQTGKQNKSCWQKYILQTSQVLVDMTALGSLNSTEWPTQFSRQ
jgi:hypothetical protein